MWLLYYGGQNDLNIGLCVYEMHMRNCQIPIVARHIFTYHFEELTETLGYRYRNELFILVEPSG